MDDLDHSIHISEYDWTSFYEDSEECDLLQPSLACADHSTLSDSEDSGNSSPVFITGQRELQQSPDVNTDKNEISIAPWCAKEVQNNPSNPGEEKDNQNKKAEEDSEARVSYEIGLNSPEGNTEEVHGRAAGDANHDVTTTLKTEQINAQSSFGEVVELKEDNGDLQTESDTCELKPIQEADPLSCNQTELNVNELHSADRAKSEDVSSVALRAERERWFVTVNDSPARQRVRVPSGKKKRRQKKSRRDSYMCRTSRQENSFEHGSTMEKNTDNRDPDICDGHSNEENAERIKIGALSDLSQMSSTSGEEEDSSSGKIMSLKEVFTFHDTFTPKGPSRFDSVESEDGTEYLSTHSYDSESYLSAAESMDELQHFLIDNQPMQRLVSSAKTSSQHDLIEHTDSDTQVVELTSDDGTVSSSATATSPEGHESPSVELSQTFPSLGQRVNKTPDDNSACVNDPHSKVPCLSLHTTGLEKHEINLPASACSSGDQLSPLTVPHLTLTPCSVADGPGTYAEAAGNTHPVFAISSFWDEMEKLTINDILQLRMGKSPPLGETQEAVTPDVGGFQTNHSTLAETEYNFSHGGLMDTSDTADSDYFTQADESKPDRSSCEFSTSDFEEEYWQFLCASRNQSPDPKSEHQQRATESPFPEEEESTCSEGKETPVPSEDFTGHLFKDQSCSAFSSGELSCPRQITKSKSVRNVPALNTEDLSLQLLLGNDDSSLFLSSCPSLAEDVALEASDSLGTLVSASFLSSTHVFNELCPTSFSGGSEYLFNDQTEKESCVTIYDPESSLAPALNYTLCQSEEEKSFFSLQDCQCSDVKPIPIFSCSHPTVRELTFPNLDYAFFSSDKGDNDISPIRIVSCTFIQGCILGTSAPNLHGFPSLLSIRKINFRNKGSIWCGSSGAWVFPAETVNKLIKGEEPPLMVLGKESVSSAPHQLFEELAMQQGILGTIQTTRRESIFSALKQSDMCLVCIAFASWVLRSSDPEAADTWKAALLANVSALSAIQYLRQYVKKKPS
ncbi:uncharacterized protein LOC121507178 [Cheilinus undulatus]|uniref:uncharacterized protein LOC121507178 n=1 Tax=Cheilinus undulatus TaxID=241271 RepID=UPI001BD43246|nr:uncharacterized protein LOC121507178 [Cheilinus undulatus]